MKKSTMPPRERIEAQRLKFVHPIPQLSDVVRRLAAANDRWCRARANDKARTRAARSPRDDTQSEEAKEVAVAEGKIGAAENVFFSARFDSLEEAADPEVANSHRMLFRKVEVRDTIKPYSYWEHNEVFLNETAKEWSKVHKTNCVVVVVCCGRIEQCIHTV